MKRKALSIALLAWLAACSSGGAILSMHAFYEIPIGATESEVVASAGKPYSIHKKGDGTIEYEYLERMKAGARDLQTRHYVIVLKDGKVVSKHMKGTTPPPYLFDSYEMQTTQYGSNADETPP